MLRVHNVLRVSKEHTKTKTNERAFAGSCRQARSVLSVLGEHTKSIVQRGAFIMQDYQREFAESSECIQFLTREKKSKTYQRKYKETLLRDFERLKCFKCCFRGCTERKTNQEKFREAFWRDSLQVELLLVFQE
ncbi:unnamed protein product [Albugo candida]|uniref:Uncharacterized protein n=1 Tax=Albugo candida TaxID=65357 RepID=A0A024FUH3_9STRA|nr:unnamed protein product [Albugo candida]|eukprot:CCI10780.1 unnamed protein product [Albugo candida]